MKKSLRILVADDDDRHRTMLSTLLKDWNYEILEASDGMEAVRLCSDKNIAAPDLVLMDVRMPGKTGLEAMEEIKSLPASPPVVIMTAYSDIPDAVDAIRNGAYDYLTKPLDSEKLKITLRNVFTQMGLIRENASLAASLAEREKGTGLLGNSPAMAELSSMIQTIAPTEATVLVSGESGTGKELAARAIHNASRRAKGPFVAINCGALTESLLVSELFGHEKGAFTGAAKKHQGLFLEATGGSIFLDEIGEMPWSMQVKLLRVLQEREILSVGGKKPQPIDCRVIAATNRDLSEEVRQGRFRQDLYYRLNVVSLNMPPLRERADDIPLLARNFATRFAARNHKRFDGFGREAMNRLVAYNWPGNVRELENVIERAVILMPGERIEERDLPLRLLEYRGSWEAGGEGPQGRELENIAPPGSLQSEREPVISSERSFSIPEGTPTLEEVERAIILQTLERMGNNKTDAAKALGISRKTLHAKLNRYKDEN